MDKKLWVQMWAVRKVYQCSLTMAKKAIESGNVKEYMKQHHGGQSIGK